MPRRDAQPNVVPGSLGAIVRALKPAAAKRIARNAGPTPTYNPSMTALTLFDLHRAALDEYRSFVRSYLNIANPRIREYVDNVSSDLHEVKRGSEE